ncbi:hypothetical protein EKD04_006120 [Chloroflexales bacterium ZM16-3]|nr:hypothetical protein [Chloroflexales bacterium ZM16-3]
MTLSEALASARYIVDADGRKTEVVIPVETWQHVLTTYERLITLLEDREDREILSGWLANRTAGRETLISLDDLERELISDGLLPG